MTPALLKALKTLTSAVGTMPKRNPAKRRSVAKKTQVKKKTPRKNPSTVAKQAPSVVEKQRRVVTYIVSLGEFGDLEDAKKFAKDAAYKTRRELRIFETDEPFFTAKGERARYG